MALVFIDGLDYYSPSESTRKWTSFSNTLVQVVPGRFGGNAFRTPNNWNQMTWTLGVPGLATYIVGGAFKAETVPPDARLFQFWDGATLHLDVRIQSSGILRVTRNGTQLGVGSTAISADTWFYAEVKFTIHDSTGSVEVKLNGTTDINLTNQDTRNGANAEVNIIGVSGLFSVGGAYQFDDFYVANTSGSVNNDFLGPVRIASLRPTAAGNYSQWTPTPNSNYVNVRDGDDNAFNYSSTANQIDSFAFEDTPIASGTVLGIQHNIIAKTDGGAARSIRAFQRSGTSGYVETAQAVASSYSNLRFVRDTNPDTSAQFTAANFASAEFGYKLDT